MEHHSADYKTGLSCRSCVYDIRIRHKNPNQYPSVAARAGAEDGRYPVHHYKGNRRRADPESKEVTQDALMSDVKAQLKGE